MKAVICGVLHGPSKMFLSAPQKDQISSTVEYVRAYPSADVARPATSSSTRGNSMTRNACAFTAACGRERQAYLESLALRARRSRVARRPSILRSRTLG